VRHLVLLLLCACLPSQAALGQEPGPRIRVIGFTLDHWTGASGPALLRPTIRFTTWMPRRPGLEVAATVFPDGFSLWHPLLTVGLQAGLAQPVRAGPVTFLLKAGGAGIVVAAPLGDDRLLRIFPGAHAGLGVLVPVDRKSTVRLDVSRHTYSSLSYGHSVWSFGFGVSGGLMRPR
jgi:hypothetical protein